MAITSPNTVPTTPAYTVTGSTTFNFNGVFAYLEPSSGYNLHIIEAGALVDSQSSTAAIDIQFRRLSAAPTGGTSATVTDVAKYSKIDQAHTSTIKAWTGAPTGGATSDGDVSPLAKTTESSPTAVRFGQDTEPLLEIRDSDGASFALVAANKAGSTTVNWWVKFVERPE